MSAPHDDLDDRDDDDDFLREVAHVEELAPPSPDSLRPVVGHVIEHFLVVAQLGRGGMGVVFLAEDQCLGRRVALKVLSPSVARDPHRRARLFREARAAAAVSHPHLVAVYAASEHEGLAYLVMEYVSGESLRRILSERDLEVEEAVRLAREILSGLAHAHRAGLLHRDLKPENVLVTDAKHAKILDFGLAKLEGDEIGRDTAGLTREGHVLGTPGYMAPEQARGHAVDGRADIFSFGATFYEMLTGVRAFDGATSADMISAVLRDEPPRVDARRPDASRELADLVARCLAKNPKDRFASCEEVLAALGDRISAAPSPTAAPAPAERGESGDHAGARTGDGPSAERKRRWPFLAVAACGVGILALAAIRATPTKTSGPPDAEVSGPMPTAMTSLPRPRSSSPQAVVAYTQAIQAFRDADWGLARERFQDATRLDASLAAAHLRLAVIMYFEHDGPADARSEFTMALNDRAALSPRDQELASALEPIINRDPGESDVSERRFAALAERYPLDAEIHHYSALFGIFGREAALAAERRAVTLDPLFADAWQILAAQLRSAGKTDEALAALERCITIAPSSADCRGERARLYAMSGQCEKMEEDLRRALSTRARGVLLWHEDRALALFSIGRSDDTVIEAMRQKWLLYEDPRRKGVELFDRALLASARGRFDEAEALVVEGERAIDLDPNVDPHARYAVLHIALLVETGRPKEAAKVAERFLNKKDVWLTRSVATDLTVPMLRTMEHAGVLPRADFVRRRDAWLERARALSMGDPASSLWATAYAIGIDRRDEATEALATMPADAANYAARDMHQTELGTAHALAGRAEDAIPYLATSTLQCDWMRWPFANTHAKLRLAESYAATGDKPRACEAYGVVVARWGTARRSRTRDAARAGAAKLACGPAAVVVRPAGVAPDADPDGEDEPEVPAPPPPPAPIGLPPPPPPERP